MLCIMLLCAYSQIFPILSTDVIADDSLPHEGKGVGGGSLIATHLPPCAPVVVGPRVKSHHSISGVSWQFLLASARVNDDDVTTHACHTFTGHNTTIALTERMLALLF